MIRYFLLQLQKKMNHWQSKNADQSRSGSKNLKLLNFNKIFMFL
jgi:hypothetical protein